MGNISGRRLAAFSAALQLVWGLAPLVLAQEVEEAQAELQAQTRREIEEIVVTARKREETLQSVPISLTVLSGDEMQRSTMQSLEDVQWQIPNLTITPNPVSKSSSRFIMRGLAQNDASVNLSYPVGVYVDGVYLARNTGQLLNMVDLERVEVLRGPQGTLFGRNTTGGALNLISKKPDGTFGGFARLTFGNYDRQDYETGIQFPILGEDVLSARISYQSANQDGYFRNRSSGNYPCPTRFHTSCGGGTDLVGEQTNAYRVVLRWRPTETLDITFQHDYTREHGEGQHQTITSLNAFTADVERVPADPILVRAGELGLLPFAFSELYKTGLVERCIQSIVNPGAGFPAPPGAVPSTLGGDAIGCMQNVFIADNTLEQFVSPSNPFKGFGGPGDHSRDVLTVKGFHGTVDWEIRESLSLKAIAAYRFLDKGGNSGNGLPYANLCCGVLPSKGRQGSEQRQWSYELQLSGRALDDRLDYVAGINYFWERGDGGHSDPATECEELFAQGRAGVLCILGQIGAIPPDDGRPGLRIDEGTNYAWGYFAHAFYNLTEQLRVSAGVRLTKERKEMRRYGIGFGDKAFFENFGKLVPECEDINGPNLAGQVDTSPTFINRPGDCEAVVSEHYSAWTWTLGLDYQWTDDVLVYAKASRGYKTGGFPNRAVEESQFEPFDEEVVMVYEVGLKADWFDNRLRTNAAAYLTKFKGLQVSDIIPDETSFTGIVTRIINAGRAEVSGGEFEVTVLPPIEGLSIRGNIGLAYDNYTNFELAGQPANQYRFQGNPRFTAGASADYVVPWRRFGEITLHADYAWKTKTFPQPTNEKATEQKDYGLVNGRISLFDEDRNLEYALFCRNCFDREHEVQGIDLVTSVGYTSAYWGPPRVFGVQLTWRFGSQAL